MSALQFVVIDDNADTLSKNNALLAEFFPASNIVAYEDANKALSYLISMQEKKCDLFILIEAELKIFGSFEFLTVFENCLAYQNPNFKVILLSKLIDKKIKAQSMKFPSIFNIMENPLDVNKLDSIVWENESTLSYA